MKAFRITLAVLLALTAVLFLVEALTVPAFAATAPALLGLAAGAVAWFVYPRRRATP